MKEYCVVLLFVFFTKESFCMDLRSKRQAEKKSESDLEDRYSWSIPTVQQLWPTQIDNNLQWFYPDQRLYQNQGGFPFNGQFNNLDGFPFGGPFPNQGRFPFDGSVPNQGRFPFGGPLPNQGRFPFDGSVPNQGRFPFGGPYPNQGGFLLNGPFSNQGGLPFGRPFSNEGRSPIFGYPIDTSFSKQGRFPNQRLFPAHQTTTQKPFDGSTTPAANILGVQECLRNCPVTSEYNPVCGTNSVTYPNSGRLMCAQACGISVNLLRSSPCPSVTTVAPI